MQADPDASGMSSLAPGMVFFKVVGTRVQLPASATVLLTFDGALSRPVMYAERREGELVPLSQAESAAEGAVGDIRCLGGFPRVGRGWEGRGAARLVKPVRVALLLPARTPLALTHKEHLPLHLPHVPAHTSTGAAPNFQ